MSGSERSLNSILLLSIVTIISGIFFTLDVFAQEATQENIENIKNIKLPFVENKGQANDYVKYYANTFAGTVIVGDSGLEYSLLKKLNDSSYDGIVFSEKFKNTNNFNPMGKTQHESKVNYFIGEQKNWKTNIPTFESVSSQNLWNGISVEFRAYNNNVEKIFTVAPFADPNDIQLEFVGINNLSIDDFGNLIIDTELGDVSFTKPVAFQIIDDEKISVPISYVINDKSYGFDIGHYDPNYELIIDPLLGSTFIGGNTDDLGDDIIVDANGNVFVIGRAAVNFPSVGTPYDPTQNGGVETFIAKFSNRLETLEVSTFLGGSGNEFSQRAITVEPTSPFSVYVTGRTTSTDFPTLVTRIMFASCIFFR